MQLLRTIAIILLVIYGLRLIGRYVMPWVLKRVMRKAQQDMESRMKQAFDQPPEGEVKITNPDASSEDNFDEGEYVDYEEIK